MQKLHLIYIIVLPFSLALCVCPPNTSSQIAGQFLPHVFVADPNPLHLCHVCHVLSVCQGSPLGQLYKCVQERIRVKVHIRTFKGLRGVCSGFVVAFDKFWNMVNSSAPVFFPHDRCQILSLTWCTVYLFTMCLHLSLSGNGGCGWDIQRASAGRGLLPWESSHHFTGRLKLLLCIWLKCVSCWGNIHVRFLSCLIWWHSVCPPMSINVIKFSMQLFEKLKIQESSAADELPKKHQAQETASKHQSAHSHTRTGQSRTESKLSEGVKTKREEQQAPLNVCQKKDSQTYGKVHTRHVNQLFIRGESIILINPQPLWCSTSVG